MYALFGLFVVGALFLDLFVNRETHEISIRQALGWTAFWIALAGAFCALLFVVRGPHDAMLFATAYVVEKALSVDNLFVFGAIFAAMRTPANVQHRVLYYGILGAFVARAVFIFGGVALAVALGPWLMAPLGGLLVYLGIQTARKDDDEEPSADRARKWLSKFLPIVDHYEGSAFTTVVSGRRFATLLLLTLVFVEITDVIFATDSVPAVVAITPDSFIAYSSNVFAILGLRSIYFALAALMRMFGFLKYGLAVILSGVGVKMILGALGIFEVPVSWTLLGIVATLAIAVVASLVASRRASAPAVIGV